MKAVKWFFILIIPINLLVLSVSFVFPGKLVWIDNYQVSVQKMIVHQLDRARPHGITQHKNDVKHTAGSIQYEELTPCLDELQPGTLFFSEHGRFVSKVFIKNDWKHCGIYLGTLQQIERYWGKDHALVKRLRPGYGSEDEYLIFDSSYDLGVAIHSIREMADLNGISTLRKLLLVEITINKEDWARVLFNNLIHLEKPYDYCFVLENDDVFYCSEFLYKLLPLEKNYFSPSSKIAGRELLLPSDLVDGILEKGISSGMFRFADCIIKNIELKGIQHLQLQPPANGD